MQIWNYFKSKKGFDRLFIELKKKYISLGRYSGTVTLKDITKEEGETLSDFFGVIIEEGSNYKTSFSKIEKKLRETKFENFTWEELFNGYFEEKLIDKKNINLIAKNKEKAFFDKMITELDEPYNTLLENSMLEKGSIYKTLIKRYHNSAKKLESDLKYIFNILKSLEDEKPTSLPVLASISGNPHFLDFKRQNSNLFIKLLAKLYKENEPTTTEEKIEFLKNHNIYVDNFSNFVITYLLESDREYINTFTQSHEVLNLNLSNLENINTLDTKSKKVFIFENPSILSCLKEKNIPIIITSGNPDYVVYKVIQKLIDSGNKVYYNGDFDPEGLCIASNLKKKFPSLELFCYKREDYKNALSNNGISNARLKKLENIKEDNLQLIKEEIIKERLSGYQEKNISRIIDYIDNLS